MTLQNLHDCFRGSTADEVRNKEILVEVPSEVFPTLRVFDFTITTDGRLVLLTERI